jgi:hypothetical protein
MHADMHANMPLNTRSTPRCLTEGPSRPPVWGLHATEADRALLSQEKSEIGATSPRFTACDVTRQ